MKKNGFTLAEILITLGVIGVVSALTMPTLIKKYQQHVTVTLLKKTYTELNQAVKFAEAEYGDMENWDWGINGINFFNKYFSRYIKIKETTRGNDNTTYYQISGKVENRFYVMKTSSVPIITVNSGYTMILDEDNNSKAFFIDINGHKKPNTFGKDMFLFSLVKSKKAVLPHAWDDGKYDNPIIDRNKLKNGPSVHGYQCNKTGRGSWCGALIIMDGWKISDDYPW